MENEKKSVRERTTISDMELKEKKTSEPNPSKVVRADFHKKN